MKRIEVGVLGGSSPAWESLLIQEGVPHSSISETSDPDHSSLLIAPLDPLGTLDKQLKDSFASGRPGLCTGETFTRLCGERDQSQRVRYLLESPGDSFSGAGLVDIESACVAPSEANRLTSERGHLCAFEGEITSSPVIALPFDPAKASMHSGTRTRSFYANRSRLPFERVSAVAKGGVRMILARSLESLHHRSGLPYAHLWYYPEGAPSVFCLRVDTDFASREEIESLYALAVKHSIPLTWFVHVKAQEQFLNVFKDMPGHEIGVHCYEHRRYDAASIIESDLSKALQLMRTAGINPKAFAAPYGYWSKEVETTAASLGFEYSSEFSRDYDNLPSSSAVPIENSMLQVPVHPMSIGGLRRQGFSSTEMRAYFADAIGRKLAARQPLIFYHHPKDGHHEVLEQIFTMVRAKGIPVSTMGSFAAWWKIRSACKIQIEYDVEQLLVSGAAVPESLRLRVSRPGDDESFCKVEKEISLKQSAWQAPPARIPLPSDISRIRKFNPWVPLIRLQDMLAPKKT
jgi:peptidoglycan/xylan/chitin deacetylase (PgdA/CDA1 family)